MITQLKDYLNNISILIFNENEELEVKNYTFKELIKQKYLLKMEVMETKVEEDTLEIWLR